MELTFYQLKPTRGSGVASPGNNVAHKIQTGEKLLLFLTLFNRGTNWLIHLKLVSPNVPCLPFNINYIHKITVANINMPDFYTFTFFMYFISMSFSLLPYNNKKDNVSVVSLKL